MVQKFSKTNKIIFLVISMLLFVGVFFTQEKVYAYGECSEYGLWATYDYLSGDCKCMSGYVFGKDFLGQTTCVSGNSVCYNKYGYNSRYDSLSSSCECSYGYVFGKDSIGRTQCVSPDSICTDRLGYNSRYNSLYDKCECRSGYVISDGWCTNGDVVCHAKHGFYSSYDDLFNSCECDSGYTFNDLNKCVEKQNNVYFTLKELDTDERRAIIKSDYDYRYYLISYNSSCYISSFRRYLNHQIVINLGTDFDLNIWDKIVLQDDDEVCDITQVERADSNTTLESEEETFYFIPEPSVIVPPQPNKSLAVPAPKVKKEFQFDETKKKSFKTKLFGEVNTSAALRECPSTTECDVVRYFNPKTKVDILGGYNEEEWYQVNIVGIESVLSGWIHSSIVNKIDNKEIQKRNNKNSEVITIQTKSQQSFLWYKRVFGFFSNLFK